MSSSSGGWTEASSPADPDYEAASAGRPGPGPTVLTSVRVSVCHSGIRPLRLPVAAADDDANDAAAASSSSLHLQLSMDPGKSGEFRLSLRDGSGNARSVTIAEFDLRTVNYEVKSPKCHELSLAAPPHDKMSFNFRCEKEAQEWATVVVSSLREAHRESLSSNDPQVPIETPESQSLIALQCTEDTCVELTRAIEAGDMSAASTLAAALAQQNASLQIQPSVRSSHDEELVLTVIVEDCSSSCCVTIKVFPHATVAALKQQVFLEYGFHPRVQRWVIGQCLCADQRSLASYGVRHHGDTAFLYLLSSRHAHLSPQLVHRDQESALLAGKPTPAASSLPPAGPTLGPGNGPSKAPCVLPQGWSCPSCTYINKPTRPGCEICSMGRPESYAVPGGYRPDPLELRRIQQEKEAVRQYQQSREQERRDNFARLVRLDGQDLVPNPEAVDCRICYVDLRPGEGVLLRECLHCFCRECLRSVIMLCEDPEVACPYRDETYACSCTLQEREIKALVSAEQYERWLQRGLSVAESRCEGSYHCATADCPGWCVYEDAVNVFHCPVCRKHNCLLCKAIHEGMNCKQYQDDLATRAINDFAARRTRDLLKTLVQSGEAMHCPQCGIIVQKKEGCDWLRCTVCHTEICWVTRGPRWGPGGPGDNSGGCRCNVNKQKCHPKCQNCH
ncbi:unnamed protein product [Merluccius merluccius]